MEIQKYVFAFCENVKELRKRRNLSKTEMARLLSISPRTLSLIENYIIPKSLNVAVLFKIEQNFDIPAEELFAPIKKTT